MRQKIFDKLRPNFEHKSTQELQSIWENNNQDEYTLDDLQVVKELLYIRNQPLPEQKEYIEKEDNEYSQEDIDKLIKGAMFFLLLFGVVQIIYWYFGGDAERQTLIKRFPEIKPILWIDIYGQAVLGIVLLFTSAVCFLQKQNTFMLIISGIVLIFCGIWNLASNLIAIPAFAQYNISLTIFKAFDDIKYFLYIFGILQIRWGYNQIKDYLKINKN